MSDKRPSINTGFGVWGDELDPDDFTEKTGLTPTKSETKGQAKPGRLLPVRETNWGITIEKRRSDNIDEPLSDLLDILWPHRTAVVQFLASYSVSSIFFTHVTIYKERPEYCLSPATIQRLAFFSVSYCMDIFDHSD